MFFEVFEKSSFFDMFRSPFMNPNNDEYFVVWVNAPRKDDRKMTDFMRRYNGFMNTLARWSTPWEQALHSILINDWRILNPKQFDVNYQAELHKKWLGVYMRPMVKTMDPRWLSIPTPDVINSVMKQLSSIPTSATIYDLCCGKGTFATQAAQLGYHVIAVDIDSTLFNEEESKMITYRIEDITRFNPPFSAFAFLDPPDGGQEYTVYTEYESYISGCYASTYIPNLIKSFAKFVVSLPLNHIDIPPPIGYSSLMITVGRRKLIVYQKT
jgi:SAM-dependent methyltransferase